MPEALLISCSILQGPQGVTIAQPKLTQPATFKESKAWWSLRVTVGAMTVCKAAARLFNLGLLAAGAPTITSSQHSHLTPGLTPEGHLSMRSSGLPPGA